jgi:type VII secretion protein EccB
LPPLPDPGLLVRQPWSVCTQTALGVSGEQTTTTLAVGVPIGGSTLGGSELLARAQGQDWVIWNGQRMLIQPSGLQALPSQSPTTVPTVWLDALPQGPAFAPPTIPGQGEPVTGPAGIPARVGQVYQVAVAGGTQYYVLLRSGLARISQSQDKLLEFEPGAPNKGNQLTLSPSQVTTHSSASAVPGGGLPPSIPAAAAPGSSAPWCVVYAAAGGSRTLTPQVQAGGQIPSGATATGNPAGVGQVALPPGAGALVGDAPGTGQGSGAISYFLVAGGRRYALASTEVAGMLGYSLSQAVLLPAGVVDLIPAGPALDPAQATRPVPSG